MTGGALTDGGMPGDAMTGGVEPPHLVHAAQNLTMLCLALRRIGELDGVVEELRGEVVELELRLALALSGDVAAAARNHERMGCVG